MSERWIVVMKGAGKSGSCDMYYLEGNGWWADLAHATQYDSKEQAEKVAFSAVSNEPSLVGCVQAEKVS